MRFAVAGLLTASFALAQSAVYEDSRVRILHTAGGAPGLTTARHEADYVWLTPGDPAHAIHFARAGATHAALKDEIVVELLQPQSNPHNVCGEILPGEYLHCHEPGAEWLGANFQIQFETEQTRIGILTIEPNATLAIPPADVPPLLIALGGTEAESTTRVNGAPAGSSARRTVKAVDILRSPADHVSEIRNVGKTVARFLVVEFGGAGE